MTIRCYGPNDYCGWTSGRRQPRTEEPIWEPIAVFVAEPEPLDPFGIEMLGEDLERGLGRAFAESEANGSRLAGPGVTPKRNPIPLVWARTARSRVGMPPKRRRARR